jgi:signal transduction histidine kinase
VFEPFFTTKIGTGGMGLGLNIAFNSAQNILGGTLGFRSEPDQGTTFTLEVPLVAPHLVNGPGAGHSGVA